MRGIRFVISRDRNASAPGPVKSYFAKLAISVTPTLLRTAQHLGLHMRKIVRAVEGDDILRLDALRREPERRLQAPDCRP